jgi:tetratricopeptide (TPR) repeat protein
MNRNILLLLFGVLLIGIVAAEITLLTQNFPDEDNVTDSNYQVLNITPNNNDTSFGMDIIVYGTNDSFIPNNSIIYRQANVTNGTNITFNWTSPKTLADSDTVLLLYLDNTTGEYANQTVSESEMILLMHFNNNTVFGENDSVIYDFSNGINNASAQNGAFFNSSGRFSGAYQFDGDDDEINAGNDTSFNISDGLTIEGWFNPLGNGKQIGNITQPVINKFEFESDANIVPKILQISDDIYAIFYSGYSSDGVVKTVNISANGTINDTLPALSVFEFETDDADGIDVSHVDGDIYAIAYDGAGDDGFIKTIAIGKNGSINKTVIDTLEFDTGNGETSSIIYVAPDIYALAYDGPGSDGFVVTVNITTDGTIGASTIDSLEFDTSTGLSPEIINVSNDIFAIVYEGQASDGFLVTVNISADGTIGNSVVQSFEYNTSDGDSPDIVHVFGDIYAITYMADSSSDDGFVSTVNISSDGTIVTTLINTFEYDTSQGVTPDIIKVSGDIYAITYEDTGTLGAVTTINITENGTIAQNIINTFTYESTFGQFPSIVNVSTENFAIVYQGPGPVNRNGFLKTINISDNGTINQTYATYEFRDEIKEIGTANFPDIEHVFGDVYAIAFDGDGGDGFVKTINISNNGTINKTKIIDIFEYDTSNGDFPDIFHINDTVFGIVYESGGNDGWIATLNISNNGTITQSVLDSFEYDTEGTEPSIIQLNGTLYAIAYWEDDNSDIGAISTVEILPNGSITGSVINKFQYESVNRALSPDFIRVNEDIYAIAYNGLDDDGYVATIQILDNGTINTTTVNTFEYDTADGDDPTIIHVSGNVYAITYTANGAGDDGFIATIEILANGSITQNVINSLEYDEVNGEDADIIHVSGDRYAIVYDGSGSDGYLQTLTIQPDGTIYGFNDTFEFETASGQTPRITHIEGDTYAIVYNSADDDGSLVTVDIATDKGISKARSYAIYTNNTHASSIINGQRITGNITTGWNHIAMTYNKSLATGNQKLFINGLLAATGTLTENITITTNNLTIGNNFNGLIDEVIIYNKTLTADKIAERSGIKVKDASGLNNGTRPYGRENFNYSGKLGPAFQFNGVDDIITVNSSTLLNMSGNFTINMWIYPTTLAKNQTLIAKGAGSVANYYIDLKDNEKIEFGFYNGAFRSISVDASNITVNNWSMVTATWNETSNTSRVYINGVDKGSSQINHDVLENSLDLKIGGFPGYDQNFTGMMDEIFITNNTLNATDIADMHRLKSRTNWYWRFSAEDNNGLNMSTTRTFLIGSVWTISTLDFGSVGVGLNTNVTVGTPTLTNTHGNKNVTINITHGYSGLFFINQSLNISLNNTNAGNNTRDVELNITSPTEDSTTTINFNFTALDPNTNISSVPSLITVQVDVVATSTNPSLITSFATAPSVVSQNNTGVSLVASVLNRGQGDAQGVVIRFILPNGWTTADDVNQTVGIVTVNQEKNASITVNISETAAAGTVTLYANVSGQNSTSGTLNGTYLTIGAANVTVNNVSAGTGPGTITTVTTTETVTEVQPGGTGPSGAASTVLSGGESFITAEKVDVVRGEESTFPIEVKNIFRRTTMKQVSIKTEGGLARHMTITPVVIENIQYGETSTFVVHVTLPGYIEKGEYITTFTISGKLREAGVDTSFSDTKRITLVVHGISKSSVEKIINSSSADLKKMQDAGFPTTKLSKLVEEANKALERKDFERARELAEEIQKQKALAFEAHDLIEKLRKQIGGTYVPSITGLFLGLEKDFSATEDILNLAVAAFEREDYETALARAKEAQLTLAIENNEFNLAVFFVENWLSIITVTILASVAALFGYQEYVKRTISSKIKNLLKEESNIRTLMSKTQKRHYRYKKMGMADFHTAISQYQKRISKIIRLRTKLRHKRIRFLEPEKVIKDLNNERKDIINSLKELQRGYFADGKVSKSEYQEQTKVNNERLAEIEDEQITEESILNTKGKKKPRSNTSFSISSINSNTIKAAGKNVPDIRSLTKNLKLPRIKMTTIKSLINVSVITSPIRKIIEKLSYFKEKLDNEPYEEKYTAKTTNYYDYNREVQWIPTNNRILVRIMMLLARTRRFMKK